MLNASKDTQMPIMHILKAFRKQIVDTNRHFTCDDREQYSSQIYNMLEGTDRGIVVKKRSILKLFNIVFKQLNIRKFGMKPAKHIQFDDEDDLTLECNNNNMRSTDCVKPRSCEASPIAMESSTNGNDVDKQLAPASTSRPVTGKSFAIHHHHQKGWTTIYYSFQRDK